MANNAIKVNQSTPTGRLIASGLNKLQEGKEEINLALARMTQQLEGGDPSQEANFAYAATQGGFDSNAKAKAGYDELNSLIFKLNANTSVTDVDNAQKQAIAKFFW